MPTDQKDKPKAPQKPEKTDINGTPGASKEKPDRPSDRDGTDKRPEDDMSMIQGYPPDPRK